MAGPRLQDVLLEASGEVDLSDFVMNRPSQLLAPPYTKLVDGLRGRMNVPVYVFPYDWRLSCATNGKRLVEFVEAVRKKPMHSLAGWSKGARRVDLVCHSLGGLVARSALGEWVDKRQVAVGDLPISTIVFVATPHLGSLEAVKAMIVGETPLLDFRKELRKLARALPSAYELLPRFQGAVVDTAGNPVDIFDADQWQSNVTAKSDGIEDVTPARLLAAKEVLDSLPSPIDIRYKVNNVVCLFGSKKETLGQVKVTGACTDGTGKVIKNWFNFANARAIDGDGVVPVESAKLKGATAIEIPYSAVGYWPSELAAFASFHAFICALDETQTIIRNVLERPELQGDAALPLNLRTWR